MQSLVAAQRDIDRVFAANDVVHIADTIDQMVASLEALQAEKIDVNMPGLAGGKLPGGELAPDAASQVSALQQRLQQIVEPQLDAALASNSTDKVADLVVAMPVIKEKVKMSLFFRFLKTNI